MRNRTFFMGKHVVPSPVFFLFPAIGITSTEWVFAITLFWGYGGFGYMSYEVEYFDEG